MLKRPKPYYDSKADNRRMHTMKYRYHLLVTLLLPIFASAASAQTASPTPAPEDDGDVVKISTDIIQLDVTVVDKKGRVINDIRREEIEIYENGKKQELSGFSFVPGVRMNDAPSTPRPIVPGIPPRPLQMERVRRTMAIVVDDLALSFESTARVRYALKRFVEQEMQDGDMVAIIRTGAGIGALQAFTNDPRQLLLAIDRIKWNPVGVGGIGAFAAAESNRPIPSGMDPSDRGEQISDDNLSELNDYRRSVFATGTLGAVNYVIRGMADLPGRKSVLLLSDGFPLFYRSPDGSMDANGVLDPLRVLIDQANRASVVVHTLDARGLVTTSLTAADDTGGMSGEDISNLENSRRDQLIDTQDGLRYLARETGGTAIINNNNLVAGLRKILDDQSYYLVSYEPDASTFNPRLRRFHRIEIRVNRPGARARHRRGFYGISDSQMARNEPTASQRIVSALTSPFAVNEIPLRLNALFFNTKATGNVIRSLLYVPLRQLNFTDLPDGRKRAVIDLVAAAFGDNGQVAEQASRRYTLDVGKGEYERDADRGFVYDLVFPIKRSGGYQLRVAVHDQGSKKVGSASQFVDVPKLKKERLTASDIAVENISSKESLEPVTKSSSQRAESLVDIALRRFNRGTILNFGVVIYNPKLVGGRPDLTAQVKIYRDGTLVFEGTPRPVDAGEINATILNYASSVSLGNKMQIGDYALQLTITDNHTGKRKRSVSRVIQFELVD
jgi:VWFA-related protein